MVVAFGTVALVAAQPGEAHRSAQFPELGLLASGNGQSPMIQFLGRLRMPLPPQQLTLEPVQFRCKPARPGPFSALQGIVQLGYGLFDLPGDLACAGEEAEKIGHPNLRPGGAVSRRAAAQKRYCLRHVATFDRDPPVIERPYHPQNGKPRSVANAMSSSARSFSTASAPASERSRLLLAKL